MHHGGDAIRDNGATTPTQHRVDQKRCKAEYEKRDWNNGQVVAPQDTPTWRMPNSG